MQMVKSIRNGEYHSVPNSWQLPETENAFGWQFWKSLTYANYTAGHQKILRDIPAFYYCSFVRNFYSELIGCRFLYLDYNSEQEMLLINHATLILRIAGMHNGKYMTVI